ncbi:MAG: sigma-54-dependent transcriptional regulator [Candidatus Cyclobacteriaceae bacterium M3_2C_046]
MKKILVVDDDQNICLLLNKFLTKNGYSVFESNNGQNAINTLKNQKIDLILCDFRLPDEDGIELLKKFKQISPNTIVIIITGYSHVKIAVQAIKLGAYDYVTKPLYPEEILGTIQKALTDKDKKKQKSTQSEQKYISFKDGKLKGIYDQISLVAPTDMTVLIQGETGTGKEYLANSIHTKSKRGNYPFIAVDCGALPKELAGSELFGHEKGAFTGAVVTKKGSFQVAHKGTLFLDEIGNLPYEIQVMMLRVLQERKFRRVGSTVDIDVDVRIIVATNEDLKKAVENGKFREDLFHRLNEFSIYIPPLRERKEDLLLFAQHFMKQSNEELTKNVKKISTEVKQVLLNHSWHGNLRELKNIMKRAVLLTQGEEITRESLPQEFLDQQETNNSVTVKNAQDLKAVSEQAEKETIIKALEQTNHNKSKTANLLKIDRKTLYNKIKTYNIKLEK